MTKALQCCIFAYMEYNRKTLEKWFHETQGLPGVARIDVPGSRAIIYKGFKIELFDTIGYIYDVRFRDVYSPVSKKNLHLMEELGFPLACMKIMYTRDVERLRRQKRILSTLSTQQLRLHSKGTPGAFRKARGIETRKQLELEYYYMYLRRSEMLKKII